MNTGFIGSYKRHMRKKEEGLSLSRLSRARTLISASTSLAPKTRVTVSKLPRIHSPPYICKFDNIGRWSF